MAQYYGVKCKSCAAFIRLGNLEPTAENEITFFRVPPESFPGPCCGRSHRYEAGDLINDEGGALFGAGKIAS